MDEGLCPRWSIRTRCCILVDNLLYVATILGWGMEPDLFRIRLLHWYFFCYIVTPRRLWLFGDFFAEKWQQD